MGAHIFPSVAISAGGRSWRPLRSVVLVNYGPLAGAASPAPEHANPAASRDRRVARKSGALYREIFPADPVMRTAGWATLRRVPIV